MELPKKKQYIILFLGLLLFSLTTTNFMYYFRTNSNRYVTDYSEEIKVKTSAGSWDTSITRAIGTNPSWLDAGDANNDGYTDIVVSHWGHDKISILTWNSGTRDWNTFIQRSTGGMPVNPVIKDVNNDGYNDIIVANHYDGEVSMYFWNPGTNNWNPEVTKYAGYNPFTVAVGDANNDGYNDIAISHFALYNTITVYLWNPATSDWHYSEILRTEWNPYHVVIEDVNNDGYRDIVSTHPDGGGLSILLWNPSSQYWDDYFFKETDSWPSQIAIADANNDQYKDIVCTSAGKKLAILLWNPSTLTWDTTIKKEAGSGQTGVFIGDANTDGKNDLVCANSADNTISILLWNSGTRDWNPQIVLPVGDGPCTPNIKDLNHDGNNDIVVTNWGDNDVSLLYWYTDNIAPSITINNPIQDEKFAKIAPNFDVDISDNRFIYNMWYTLNVNPKKYFFTSNGPIQDWATLSDGTVTITFFANDSAGNQNSDWVSINKDATDPIVNLISPLDWEIFGENAPNYIVEIYDVNLDSMWYTYPYDDPTKYFFTDNGTLNGWAGLPDGYITIRFYANDTYGNVVYSSVGVQKDTTSPEITIYSPDPYDFFADTAPSYNIYAGDISLDTMWYTLNDSSDIIISSRYGDIDQTLWDCFLSTFINITFFANDSFSRISSESVVVIKDIDDPIISVYSPFPNELFGIGAPMFDVIVTESYLDEIWYSLDNGLTNYTFDTMCDQEAWDTCGNGTVTISFYAKDMAGNIGFSELIIRKDSIAPNIIINSPDWGQEFSSNPPSFDLSIIEANLDEIWYSFNEGETKYLCGLSGQIDANLWNILANGNYSIRFYANDTVGNENFAEVLISKNVPQSRISFELIIIVSAIGVGGAVLGISIIFLMRRRRKTT